MKCFKLGNILKTKSPKCEEKILKNMKSIMSQSVIPSSWSWYQHFQNILSGTTKMNSAIGGIDQGVQLFQLQELSLDDLFETILKTTTPSNM
jgi:hypothetical protein